MPLVARYRDHVGEFGVCEGVSGFFSGWEKFRFVGEFVYRSCRKKFPDFSRTHEIFSGVSASRQKNMELFLKTRKTKKEFQRINFSEIFLTRKKYFRDFFADNKRDHFLTDDT
jgi:hypothetical protein